MRSETHSDFGSVPSHLRILVPIVRLRVHGPEVQAGADVAGAQGRHEGVAGEAGRVEHLDHVEVPGVEMVVGGHPGPADLRHLGEQLVVEGGQLDPPGVELVHRGELVDAERRLDVHEVVLEAGQHDLDLRRPPLGVAVPGLLLQAVEAQGAQLFRQLGVGEGQHPPLAGGHVLDRMEGEGGQPVEQADVLPLVERPHPVGRVLEDPERVPARNFKQRIHVAWSAAEVDGENAHRPVGHRGGHGLGIDLQGLGVDLHEHRLPPQRLDHVGGGGPGHRGDDHLVSRLQAEGDQADVEPGGGRGERERPRARRRRRRNPSRSARSWGRW